jgi:hypothetical protein
MITKLSNSIDSVRRINGDTPVIVSLKSNNGNYEFTVEDKGTGLDDEEVKNIISKYGKSTKRDKVNEIGALGLGWKSPLSYSSSFYFVCRKNGVERKYMMYEGENVNSIDLLYETETEEANGVKIIVPVKYNDRYLFYQKIKEQLAYFSNVYFDIDSNIETIDNNFKITRGELFQYSELSNDRNLHLCLDDVYYPLDFNKLGIDVIKIPLAIRCSLTDGVFPIPNREQLIYNIDSKKIILSKIKAIANYFVNKFNENSVNTNDIKKIFEYYSDDTKYVDVGEIKINIKDFTKHSDVIFKVPTLNNVSLLNLERLFEEKDFILSEYSHKFSIQGGRFNKRHYSTTINYRDILNKNIFVYSEYIPKNKKEYLKSIYNTGIFIKKHESFKLGNNTIDKNSYTANRRFYYKLLDLKNYNKKFWRQIIKEFESIKSSLIESFVNVDELEIPKEWTEARKKKKLITISSSTKKVKLEGEITVYKSTDLERTVFGKNCKFVAHQYKLNDLHKQNSLIIFGTKDDESLMQKLHPILGYRIQIFIISEREMKKLENIKLHNFINIHKFMEGKNMPFKRMVTAYCINLLIVKNKAVFDKLNVLNFISSDLYNKLVCLQNYKEKWYVFGNEKIYKAMLIVAEDGNLFDENIFSTYKECRFVLNKLDFLNTLCNTFPSHYSSSIIKEDDKIVSIIKDMCKYYKFKLNWKNYNLPLNEEKIETLSEETLTELCNN